jgi:hypothetical protein
MLEKADLTDADRAYLATLDEETSTQ